LIFNFSGKILSACFYDKFKNIILITWKITRYFIEILLKSNFVTTALLKVKCNEITAALLKK